MVCIVVLRKTTLNFWRIKIYYNLIAKYGSEKVLRHIEKIKKCIDLRLLGEVINGIQIISEN